MHIPCHECSIRRGYTYTKDCDDKCSYASAVKCRDTRIKELEMKLRESEELREQAYYVIGQMVDKPNIFDTKKSESSKLIRMMKNGILPPLSCNEG